MGSIWKEIIIRKPFTKVYGNSTFNLPRAITYKKMIFPREITQAFCLPFAVIFFRKQWGIISYSVKHLR